MLPLNPAVADLKDDASAGLIKAFGSTATIISVAPGRINLLGDHIDYCDGLVLPFAIERYAVIAGTPNGSNTARIASSAYRAPVAFALDHQVEPGEPKWINYFRGVIRGFQDRGYHIPGFDAYVTSSIPAGAGLSSSAAIECAMATFLEGLCETVLDSTEKAQLCQKAEHDFANVPCGLMDQYTSVFGKPNQLLLLDCRSNEATWLPFDHPDLTILITNTMVHHNLADGAYAKRRDETEQALSVLGKTSWREVSKKDVLENWNVLGDPLNRRARHITSETARVIEASSVLRAHDFETLGALMDQSHESLKNDFEVSCEALDVLVAGARHIGRHGGVIGSRMTGGGFGGSTITLCETEKAPHIAEKLSSYYHRKIGIIPQWFTSRPTLGAHRIMR